MDIDIFSLELGQFGASGFTLEDRLDMSGPKDPHIDTDIRPVGSDWGLRLKGGADFRDLSHNQIDGFNGMQAQQRCW